MGTGGQPSGTGGWLTGTGGGLNRTANWPPCVKAGAYNYSNDNERNCFQCAAGAGTGVIASVTEGSVEPLN